MRTAVPRRSEFLVRWFRWWVRGYLRKHFHAVRLARGGRPDVPPDVPLLIVLNHPSWWDPLLGVVLSGLFPHRTHYAPMEAGALACYPLLNRLGFYGVEPGGPRGAVAFLRTTTALLAQPGAAVWLTAQGRFADVRERPPRLRPGVGHLAARLGRGAVVPLALEYPFWDERLPEALARFGEPIEIGHRHALRPAAWVERVECGLAAAQDALAADARRRDASAFETLLAGGAGVGGLYDRWRRFSAWLRGERFRAEHGAGDGRPCR